MAARMTIARMLALGFAVMVFLLVLAVALGLNRLAVLNAQVESVVLGSWERTVLANRAIDLMNAQTQDTLRLFLPGDPGPIRQVISARIIAIRDILEQLDAELSDPQSRALLKEITSQRSAYVASFLQVAELLDGGQRESAESLIVTQTIPRLNAVLESMDALIALKGSILAETGSASLAAFKQARALLASFLVIAVLAALLLSSWITRAVVRPLGGEPAEVKRIVDRIAAGDLAGDIRLRDGDETSLLAAMSHMQSNLRSLIADRTRAERSMHESRQRLFELVETLRDWMWEVDTDWRYTFVSPQVRDLLGYEPEEVLGRTPFDLMAPEDAERLRPMLEVNRGGLHPIVALENVNLHKNGQRVVLETSGRPYFDAAGRFAGYRGLDREVSDRKQAEAKRLEEAGRLREALVREVHHRIKNNLQTVIGLLRREAVRRPLAHEAIEGAINQVQAVAVVHGLYGRVSGHSILLCELLPAVVSSVFDLTGVPIVQEGLDASERRLLVRESETVAVALILNELLTNAVKHSSGAPEEQIHVTFVREQARGSIRIRNPGRLAPEFDFDSGKGVGTGLGLVRALIPVPGVSLRFIESDAGVEVVMTIEPPVVVSPQNG